jgi:hypothetical protein
MINQGPINAGPINGLSAAQGGLSARAVISIAGIARPVPPFLSLVTDQRRILVFTVEVYPSFIPDRSSDEPALALESGELWSTEGGDLIGQG